MTFQISISMPLFIIFITVLLFLMYVIIEFAVNRGIDKSKTSEMIDEILENLKKNNS